MEILMIERISDLTEKIVRGICIAMVSVFTGTVLLQVFCRYVLNNSLSWPEELAKYTLVWMTFIAASSALKKGYHVGVDYFVDRLPIRTLVKIIKVFVNLLIISFLAVMIVYGVKQMEVTRTLMSPSLKISFKWVYLGLPVGSSLMMIQAVCNLVKTIKEI